MSSKSRYVSPPLPSMCASPPIPTTYASWRPKWGPRTIKCCARKKNCFIKPRGGGGKRGNKHQGCTLAHPSILYGALKLYVPKEQSKDGREIVGEGCVTISHAAARWFIRPQGSPSGVCTGQRKPQDSGSSLRTVVVRILRKAAPLCTQRKWER